MGRSFTYLIEQAWKAADKSNHAARKDHAKQAEALVLRSMRIGHFDIAKANPILTLIQELLIVRLRIMLGSLEPVHTRSRTMGGQSD